MTAVSASVIASVVPPLLPRSAGRAAGGSAAPSLVRGPLSLPSLIPGRTSRLVYGLAAVDDRGRVADRVVLRALSTSPGGRPTCPNPTGMSTGGNHRSHCANSPGSYSVREAGSGGRNNGRSWCTRSKNTVLPALPADPLHDHAGRHVRNSASNARICGSTASTIDGLAARTYRGGSCELNARRTVFREIRSRRVIALIDNPSARCSRRISAQSSTLSTPSRSRRGQIHPEPGGQSCGGSDRW
jgi:hypothetical protein